MDAAFTKYPTSYLTAPGGFESENGRTFLAILAVEEARLLTREDFGVEPRFIEDRWESGDILATALDTLLDAPDPASWLSFIRRNPDVTL